MERTVGLVLARGGSRGVPGKNLRPLGGISLLGRAIQTLAGASAIDRVVLSTDDPAIAAEGLEHGADVPFVRPADLATDSTPAIAAVAHAARCLRAEGDRAARIVLLQATAPFTTSADVTAAIDTFDRHPGNHLVSVTEASEHPHWMATVDGDELQFLFDAETRAHRRQDLPAVYRLNGAIYIYDVDTLLSAEPDGAFDWGSIAAYVMPRERSIDIDTESDWQDAEAQL